jgi:3-phenylpropionate/cinnamic acid dioxygenase small subunit
MGTNTVSPAQTRSDPVADGIADLLLHQQVSQFLYNEARLLDAHDYTEWESLWTDDAIYWIPANGDDTDPEVAMSIIYDNRSRIALRVRQLHTGKRIAAEPRARISHLVSSVAAKILSNGEIEASTKAMVFESNLRGETVWSCSNRFLLRRHGATMLKMARKEVVLTNNDKPLFTLSFLI